jgi:hypothetical protein
MKFFLVYVLCAQGVGNILYAYDIIDMLCVQDIFRARNRVFDLARFVIVLCKLNFWILFLCLV